MSFIKEVFGSIVVSISACHSKEQLAGGRGSIPRQRDNSIIFFQVLLVPWWSGGAVGALDELRRKLVCASGSFFLRESDSIAWGGEVGLASS
jgi:hypothetical protein